MDSARGDAKVIRQLARAIAAALDHIGKDPRTVIGALISLAVAGCKATGIPIGQLHQLINELDVASSAESELASELTKEVRRAG